MKINSADLTVISVMQNDSGLGALMVDSVKRFTRIPPKIIIANQGGNGKIIANISNDPVIKVVQVSTGKVANTSHRHALGLNALLPLVKTTYCAIVESDCVVLRDDWFDFDINKYDMMASLKRTEFNEEQYHVCFLVFKTELLRGVDWKPIKEIEPKKYWRDTGFRVFSHIKGMVEKIHYLKIKTNRQSKIFIHGFEHKSFEIYKDDGMPIAAHFGRGSDLSRRPPNKIGFAKHQKREWSRLYHEFIRSKGI